MLQKIREFLLSPYYAVFIFFLSVAAYLFGDGAFVVCLILEVVIAALVLCISDRLSPLLLPALTVSVLGTTLIGRVELILPYLPWAIPILPALLFHLIFYRKVPRIGISFFGLLATAAAILLSGLGNRGGTDYSDPTALYYLLATSVGLLLFYLIFSAEVKSDGGRDCIHAFLSALCYTGGLCTLVIAVNLVKWLSGQAGGPDVNDYYALMPFRNTLANLLTICLPAPFYFAGYVLRRHTAQVSMFLIGCIFYSAMLMTVARTAMLFGTVVLIFCLIYYLRGKGEWYFKVASLLIVLLGLSVLGISLYEPIAELFSSRLEDGLASVGEARWELLLRSFSDFCEHPIFGIGFASTDNADIYAAEGCISWYHLYFPQIWGSLGIVGCIAFAFQLLLRAKLIFYRPNASTVAVALTYLGLFLYSQTDPGEFVPVPFAVLAVLMFVLLEKHYEAGKRKAARARTES